MQRWIAVGLVAVMLVFGGGLFAYYSYKQNRPAPVWVPLPVNSELSATKRDEIISDLRTKLSDEQVLLKVSQDVGLAEKWNLASDKEAAREIGSRLFVKAGEADTPMGKVPAIHVGMTGTRREHEVSGKITMRLMDDVWKILGIKQPLKKGF